MNESFPWSCNQFVNDGVQTLHRIEAQMESRRILASVLAHPDWKTFVSRISQVSDKYRAALAKTSELIPIYRYQGAIEALDAICRAPEDASRDLKILENSATKLREQLRELVGRLDETKPGG